MKPLASLPEIDALVNAFHEGVRQALKARGVDTTKINVLTMIGAADGAIDKQRLFTGYSGCTCQTCADHVLDSLEALFKAPRGTIN
jgi:hypothetical protein